MQPRLQPDLLLAKSFDPGHWKGSYSLVGHTADVLRAVTTLVDVLGNCAIAQFGLQCSFEHLRNTARLAAYLHDWGKANHHFQGVVRSKMKDAHPKRHLPDNPQMIRHEVASVLLAWEFKEWLEQAEGDFLTAVAAGGGHHLKLGGRAGKRTDQLGELRQSGEDKLSIYALELVNGKQKYNRHFQQLLKYGIKNLGLPKTIKLSQKPSLVWSSAQIKEKRREIADFLTVEWEADPVFLAVVKALLVAGDAIGSAIAPMDVSLHKWVEEEVSRTLDETKLQKVIDARLDGHELRPFQIELAQSQTRVALARAGCGTGKTLGAYNWAKSQALGRKLFFCYPTTGTSTEGFIDYVHNQVDAALITSRAKVDLEMMKTGEEEDAGDTSSNEVAIKLDSFQAWGKEAVICTVDTVLGMLQCNRRPLYCFPAIAQGAFVFDEVHCYDERLFGGLLRFLETVKAPILLMSASFLPWQKAAIEEAVGEKVEIIEGPKDLEEYPRYRFQVVETPDWTRIEQELQAEGKVLWVCNQVDTAIDVYRKAKERNLNALLYHSRYRYEDRVKHHRAVVDGFKPDQPPVLAITTQVAEMSLDLSATLLVTQIADPAGLIQRLGRLNRRYCGHALDAIFYPDPKKDRPYSEDDRTAGSQMIETFTGEVSQAELAAWLEASDTEGEPDRESVMLDGKWRTYPAPVRKAGFNITAILEKDIETVRKLSAKDIPRYTVPLPNYTVKGWKKHKFYPIAPKEVWDYCEELGAYQKEKGGESE